MNSLNHIAFIMDGNGRWGEKKGKGRNFGHLKGVETVKKIVKESIKLNIPILTFYVFSSENWKRPEKEKNYLFKLIKRYFSKKSITTYDYFSMIKDHYAYGNCSQPINFRSIIDFHLYSWNAEDSSFRYDSIVYDCCVNFLMPTQGHLIKIINLMKTSLLQRIHFLQKQ